MKFYCNQIKSFMQSECKYEKCIEKIIEKMKLKVLQLNQLKQQFDVFIEVYEFKDK